MTDIRAELRHQPPADLSNVGDDPGLVARIRDEIARTGPMPFARFMELALYDPDGGYYRGAEPRPGRGGDFLTAPELHPIFGEMLARAVLETWEVLDRPESFVVREHGAGEGALAASILTALQATPLGELVRYQAIEIDDRRLARLRGRLEDLGLDRQVEPASGDDIDGVVLANEVLDALPVHRVRRRGDAMRELAVTVAADGSFAEVEIEPSTPALADRLAEEHIELADGQTAEVCLALDRWVADVARGLARGMVLIIDYGAPASELYDPVRRREGTLRAYVRHQVHADPYRFVGRQDLTAHVDVTAVERAAHAAGLTTIGITTQAEALIGLGLEERVQGIQADPATTLEEYALLRSALLRLLDPAAMGRFRVLAFGRGWPEGSTLRLFAYRLGRSADH